MDKKILVPLDGSPTATRTVQGIIREKHRFFGPLTLLHVIDEDNLIYRMSSDFQIEMIRGHARKTTRQLLETHQERLTQSGIAGKIRLVSGSPRQMACRIATDKNFRLVILAATAPAKSVTCCSARSPITPCTKFAARE